MIIVGMIQLHEANIIHGDIKPQNILLTSASDDDEIRAVVAGTSAYMAPELLNASVIADYSSDVYSFGILLNELCVEVLNLCRSYV